MVFNIPKSPHEDLSWLRPLAPREGLTMTQQRAEQLRRNLLPSMGLLVAIIISLAFGLTHYAELGVELQDQVQRFYTWFIHVEIMVFVGFGFLMCFLRRYSFGAVALNFLLSCLIFLMALLIVGAAQQTIGTRGRVTKITVNLELLIDSTFCAAAGMIAFGAIIGKATPTQLVWTMVGLVPAYALNQYLVIKRLGILDMGGSNVIHLFGCYYGLAVSAMLSRQKFKHGMEHPKSGSSYLNDVFSMIGTLFLWIYWPSFNGALASVPHVATSAHFPGGNPPAASAVGTSAQFLCIVNTVISLSGSAVATFMASVLVGGRMNMVHVQNSTLAGGVAMGAACTLNMTPGGALVVGLAAGALSVLGFQYLTPALNTHLGLRDTCGIHNLHGLPGILGSVVAGLAALGLPSEYYPRASGGRQLGYQVAGVCVAMGIAIVWGIIVGLIVTYCNPMSEQDLAPAELFDDGPWWQEQEVEFMVDGSVGGSRQVSHHGVSLLPASMHKPKAPAAQPEPKEKSFGHANKAGAPTFNDAFLQRHHELEQQQKAAAAAKAGGGADKV